MANWLSPLSDHFPTPRGNHFMSAPIPQSDDSSDAGSISPSPSSAPWTRDSYTTEATEFDDLYDVSSDEETRRKKTIVRRNSARQATKSNRSSADSSTTRSSRTSLPALVIPSSQSQSDPSHLSRNPTILQMLAAYLPHHPQLPGPGTATQPRLLNSTISMMFLQTKRQGERRLLSEETVPGKQPSPTDHLLIRAPPEVLELLSPLLSFLHLNLKATHGQELQLSNS